MPTTAEFVSRELVVGVIDNSVLLLVGIELSVGDFWLYAWLVECIVPLSYRAYNGWSFVQMSGSRISQGRR